MATVADVMSRDVLTVRNDSTLGQVARVLRERNVGSALVVDAAMTPVGIITERELVDSVAASRNPDLGLAGSWMLAEPRTIDAAASIHEASVAMREANVRHLPVVEAGRVAGVVSIRDLLAATM
jgi:signal-transduction protein with cAMP-binding, CBS, and nucleotidyltransferase domain